MVAMQRGAAGGCAAGRELAGGWRVVLACVAACSARIEVGAERLDLCLNAGEEVVHAWLQVIDELVDFRFYLGARGIDARLYIAHGGIDASVQLIECLLEFGPGFL